MPMDWRPFAAFASRMSRFFKTLRRSNQVAPKRPERPRKVVYRPGASFEGLEKREVPSGAVGVEPLAVIPGDIAGPRSATIVRFELNPGTYVSNNAMPMTLSLDATPAAGSTIAPKVVGLIHVGGSQPYKIETRHGPFLTRLNIPLVVPSIYAVKVDALGGTRGAFNLNITMPGDVRGTGVVDRVDLGLIRASLGAVVGSPRYHASMDLNGDGRVGTVDLKIANGNLGADASVVSITPLHK